MLTTFRLRSILLLAFCVLTKSAVAGATEEHGKGANPACVTAIDGFLSDPVLVGGFQGMVVQSLSTGKILYERNADLFFLPASNQKLLTSSAILAALGPNWTFTTTLQRAGNLDDDGMLHGNLYLKGSGDPLLASADLDLFADSVKAAGIKKVQGKVVGDDSRFDRKRLGMGWEWDDLPYYYAPEVSGLNLNKNLISLSIDPGRSPGDPLRVTAAPPEKLVKITVRGRTEAKGKPDTVTVTRDLGTNELFVDGVLPLDVKPGGHKTVSVTVENPTHYATAYLAARLKSLGIGVAGGETEGVTPTTGTVEIARHTGDPLADVLKKMNKPSDNLIAECLLKTLGAEKSKDGVGSWESGSAAAKEWFKSIGIDPATIVMEDGSGMSRHNYVTPRSYALMLKTMASHPYGKVFKDSLPVPGVDGTLANRPIGPNARKSCRAKTGYVANVSSLSGYVDTRSGEPLLFVIFMNNHQCPGSVARSIQDKIVEFLASQE